VWEAPVFIERTSVGLDVHARSVVAAAIDGVTGEVFRARLTPACEDVLGWVRRLPGPSAAVYEAGPTGFGLARALAAASIRCEVAAPSKLQRPAGDRVKTDARDAMHLAKLLRLDEVVSVRVPTLDQEAAKDLVRAREDVRGDLMRARHRLSKLLLRQGIVYSGGQAWTGTHDVWLRGQSFERYGVQLAFDADYEAVLLTAARRDPLDAAIEAMAANSEFNPVVRRLSCLRGVSTLTAFALAVEVGDWGRFTGSTIGSYLGLVPGEYSSGASRVQGSITETGTPTPGGSSLRPHGTTARPTATPARSCVPGGTWLHRPPGLAAMPAIIACTIVGSDSSSEGKSLSSRTSPSPANSPGGAGRWP
jgi:transposase